MLRRSSKVSLRGDSARDSFSSYLLKRSGGHEGHTTLRKKFQERFFVLQGTNLLYFRSQDEYLEHFRSRRRLSAIRGRRLHEQIAADPAIVAG